MSSPARPDQLASSAAPSLWRKQFRSMGSVVELVLTDACAEPRSAFEDVVQVFEDVDSECTRFDPFSDLMMANALGDQWCAVGQYCFAAIEAAADAHVRTTGRFDPRVLDTLIDLGYDRSLSFDGRELSFPARTPRATSRPTSSWTPGLDSRGRRVQVGPTPIDLGGIGKGLAVRWAAERVAARCDTFLIDAGGDCFLGGAGPDGQGWSVGVEDPHGGSQPVAVLSVTDAACATSSVRIHHWRLGGVPVHHLIDPRTGAPGGDGLLSVTVVDTDPADAEVWTKTLFLAGAQGIAAAAEASGIAALWVHEDGRLEASATMWPAVQWTAR